MVDTGKDQTYVLQAVDSNHIFGLNGNVVMFQDGTFATCNIALWCIRFNFSCCEDKQKWIPLNIAINILSLHIAVFDSYYKLKY